MVGAESFWNFDFKLIRALLKSEQTSCGFRAYSPCLPLRVDWLQISASATGSGPRTATVTTKHLTIACSRLRLNVLLSAVREKLACLIPSVILMRLKAQTSWWTVPNALGVLILFVVITSAVFKLAPDRKAPEEQRMIITAHQAMVHFEEGEDLARQLLSDPSAQWSHYITDRTSSCVPLGNGIWFSKGTVQVHQEGEPNTVPWQICFIPGGSEVLFGTIGNSQWGDLQSTMQMAHQPWGKPNELSH